MKARGRNYQRMSKKDKKKIDRTIKRMKKVRNKDSKRLRKTIEEKLEWAINEKNRGVSVNKEDETKIRLLQSKINTNTRQILRLDGIILALSDILGRGKK